MTGAAVTTVLLVTGLMSVLGNLTGGHSADRRLRITVITGATAALGVLVLMNFATGLLLVALLALWQFLNWATAPALSLQLYRAAGPAADLAVGLTPSVFNLGIVLGAALGGLALHLGGFAAVLYGALTLAAPGLALVLLLVRGDSGSSATSPERSSTLLDM